MENIIKGLEILKAYNGKLISQDGSLVVGNFKYKNFLKDDKAKLLVLGWNVYGFTPEEIINVTYDLPK